MPAALTVPRLSAATPGEAVSEPDKSASEARTVRNAVVSFNDGQAAA